MSNSQLPDVDQQYRSGISYGNALKVLSDQNPRQRKALLDDVLGSELTLLAPLRHVVCLPAFQKLITDSSYTQLLLNRDALLLDLAAWCNQESLSRIAAFLDGVIQVFWPTHIASFRQAHERGFGNSAEGPDSTTQNIFNKSPVEDFSWEKNSPTSIKAIIADLLTKAQQAVHNGAHEKSIKLLSQVLRLDPSRADVYIKRAQMYISVRDTASAIQDYSEALRLQPRNSEARARRGEAHLLLGNMEGAREDWKQAAWSGHQQAIELITEHTLKTSQNLLTSLRGNEAIILLNEAIQVNPSDANLLITRGIAYQATNQHGQAKADFTSALKINPTIAQAYALRGKSYAIQGKEALAISDLEIAIGFGSAVATTLLADLKLKKSNNDPTSYSKDQEENRELDSKLNDNIKTPRISKKRPHGILSTMTLIVILVFGIAVSKKQGLQDPNTSLNTQDTKHSLIDKKLRSALLHAQGAALICEHEQTLATLRNTDFSIANKLQLSERERLIHRSMSAIKQLKQPGKLAYQEDCTKGIGMQPYDKYDWQSGSGYKGSVFAVASRRCSSPAIQVNTYRDEKQQHLVHSEWISFVPDQSGSTAEVSFRIPDYKIKDLPLIWIDYNTRCNAFTQ